VDRDFDGAVLLQRRVEREVALEGLVRVERVGLVERGVVHAGVDVVIDARGGVLDGEVHAVAGLVLHVERRRDLVSDVRRVVRHVSDVLGGDGHERVVGDRCPGVVQVRPVLAAVRGQEVVVAVAVRVLVGHGDERLVLRQRGSVRFEAGRVEQVDADVLVRAGGQELGDADHVTDLAVGGGLVDRDEGAVRAVRLVDDDGGPVRGLVLDGDVRRRSLLPCGHLVPRGRDVVSDVRRVQFLVGLCVVDGDLDGRVLLQRRFERQVALEGLAGVEGVRLVARRLVDVRVEVVVDAPRRVLDGQVRPVTGLVLHVERRRWCGFLLDHRVLQRAVDERVAGFRVADRHGDRAVVLQRRVEREVVLERLVRVDGGLVQRLAVGAGFDDERRVRRRLVDGEVRPVALLIGESERRGDDALLLLVVALFRFVAAFDLLLDGLVRVVRDLLGVGFAALRGLAGGPVRGALDDDLDLLDVHFLALGQRRRAPCRALRGGLDLDDVRRLALFERSARRALGDDLDLDDVDDLDLRHRPLGGTARGGLNLIDVRDLPLAGRPGRASRRARRGVLDLDHVDPLDLDDCPLSTALRGGLYLFDVRDLVLRYRPLRRAERGLLDLGHGGALDLPQRPGARPARGRLDLLDAGVLALDERALGRAGGRGADLLHVGRLVRAVGPLGGTDRGRPDLLDGDVLRLSDRRVLDLLAVDGLLLFDAHVLALAVRDVARVRERAVGRALSGLLDLRDVRRLLLDGHARRAVGTALGGVLELFGGGVLAPGDRAVGRAVRRAL